VKKKLNDKKEHWPYSEAKRFFFNKNIGPVLLSQKSFVF
jgi:hypothetical protein